MDLNTYTLFIGPNKSTYQNQGSIMISFVKNYLDQVSIHKMIC